MADKIEINVHNWSDIEEKYLNGSLILGNGASVAFDERFLYKSLLQKAIDEGFITKEVDAIFHKLGTNDFELILSSLATTRFICEKLEIKFIDEDFEKINDSYQQVRESLVKTVRKIHPEYEEVVERLPVIANFMKKFRTVFSFNYDLLTYWAMLIGNDNGDHEFKDCFRSGIFYQDFEDWREPYNSELKKENVTLVFYPHGNLILSTRTLDNEEVKIKDKRGRLLSTILNKWEAVENTPLFVSEGSEQDKLNAINRSVYLNSIYNRALKKSEESFVIYGWSIALQDRHLLRAISKAKPSKIAISIYDRNQAQAIENNIKAVIGNIEVDFFHYNSENCWVNQ